MKMNFIESIPDGLKVSVATAPSALTIVGVPMEQWTYVASAIVSVMFIIEKFPVLIERLTQFKNWIKKNVKRKEQE